MKKFYLILIVLINLSFLSSGQTFSPVISTEVMTSAIAGDTSNSGLVDFSDTTVFKTELIVSLFDTLGISKVNVLLRSDLTGSVLLQKYFTFDNFGTFNDGTSYNRIGTDIFLELGNYTGMLKYYTEVSVENTSGQVSPVMIFSR